MRDEILYLPDTHSIRVCTFLNLYTSASVVRLYSNDCESPSGFDNIATRVRARNINHRV